MKKYIVEYTDEDGCSDYKIVDTEKQVNEIVSSALEEDGTYIFEIDFNKKTIKCINN